MKKLSLVILVALVSFVQLEAKVSVTNLRTERLENPMSLDTPTPRLGWQIESDKQNVLQTAYHLIVSSSREKAEALEGDIRDRKEQSAQSQWVELGDGKALRSNTRCYWRVKITTNQGETEWSDVAMFNIGLLNESDWGGDWIGMDHANAWDKEDEHSQLSARYLRTTFGVESKPVRQATLYVSGLGMYEAYINGQKIGDDVLAPAPTDYRKTILYNAYDVTNLAEKNCLAVVLGNGRYYTMQQKKKPYKIANFGYPKLRLNLIIEYTDGTRKVISSSEKWTINADGAIRSNNEYDGEIYDATKNLTNWTSPDYDDSKWLKAERVAIPLGTLRGAMSPNMKVVKTLQPKSVTKNGDAFIVDFGQNMAGWLKIRLKGTKSGDVINIRYAEKLDSAGNLWRENFRHANSTDTYIANGQENNIWWHPTFVYHGGRYAEITGLRNRPVLEDFIVEVVSDALATTGSFETSDPILQQIFHNAYWGVLSNYKGFPVDCPQRDERQPWLGDRTRGCFGEAFLFDNNTLYAKWVRDITEAQREDGCIPDVAPAFWNYYSDNVTWPAALPMALDMMIRQYGDDKPMRKFYPNVKRWLEHLKYQYQQDGLMPRDKYADWCVPPEKEELIHSQDPARVTDGTLIATAYYYKINRMMADFARMQGFQADAKYFDDEAALSKDAFNRKFLHVKKGTTTVPGHILYPDSTFYSNNTVTANLLPLTFGMIEDDYVKQEVQKNIVKNIMTDNGGHVSCGVIGISWLMHGLTDMGRSDIAWHLATSSSYPSWGYMAKKGATTTWELWNGDTASPKMNSGNHVMLLGDLVSWLFEDAAGIQSADGFRHITLKPDFTVPEMDNIRASYQSIYGPVVSQWKKEQNQLLWHVEIPANTEATIYLPDGTTKKLGSGSYDLKASLLKRIAAIPENAAKTVNPASTSIVADEFLYTKADFPQCHSASIVETRKGDLVATYFGGTGERNPDVCIWVSRKPKGAKEWTAPQMVADGVELKPIKPNPQGKVSLVTTSQKPAFGGKFVPLPEWASWKTNRGEAAVGNNYREACWNPVLFETPSGELQLYFKIGPNVAEWKGWICRSKDGGKTWSRREPLPDDIYGPIKNKPVVSKGRLISPTSDERDGWKLYFEYSDDMGKTWKRSPFVEADSGIRAIQPSIIFLPDGRLQAVCRTRSRHIGVTYSSDNGETWSKLQLIETPNNNSGLDAVTLKDGTFALICNHWPIEPDKEKGARTPLALMKSKDGIHWEHWMTLEDSPISQYSYPSIIQSKDGHIHVVYTWRRQRVKHVEVTP